MLPSATELLYFIEIAATENISRASERLGVTQPTLSVAIKRLEHHVGTELLIRYKTGVKLTKAGGRFQNKARALLEHWDNVLQSVKRDEDEIGGCYSIGAHVSVASNRLSVVLPRILEQHPSLELQLHHDLSRRITERVINFELDFGVVVNPVSHPDLVIRKLYDDEVGFFSTLTCASQEVSDKVLCYDPDLLQARWLLKHAREAGVSFKRTVVSSSLEIIASLCAQGAGIAILPKRVAEVAKGPPLIQILKQLPVYGDSHALIYRSDAHLTTAAKKLARHLEQELKDN